MKNIKYTVYGTGCIECCEPLSEMFVDLHGIRYLSILAPYEVVKSVLEHGEDNTGSQIVLWEGFSISRDEYLDAAKIVVKRCNIKLGNSVSDINTLDEWYAYLFYRYSGLPSEDYLRISRKLKSISCEIDGLVEESEVTGIDTMPRLQELVRIKSDLSSELVELRAKHPMPSKEVRSEIDRVYNIAS